MGQLGLLRSRPGQAVLGKLGRALLRPWSASKFTLRKLSEILNWLRCVPGPATWIPFLLGSVSWLRVCESHRDSVCLEAGEGGLP